ncbi:sensor histidine kinase [Embleya sp. MST-111070]|uniref:sensor histidine kinase n=1 Tax=Embleya sp. MST-111070 TaxID=3398231 RepID=UPI003F737848
MRFRARSATRAPNPPPTRAGRPLRPAVARLRRLRWTLTALFTLTTAVCLVVLAVVAGSIDGQSRDRELDNDLDRRVSGLSRALYYEDGTLRLDSLHEDELVEGDVAIAVVEWDPAGVPRRSYAEPADSPLLPSAERLTEIGADAREVQSAVAWDAEGRDGRTVRVAAAPVWEGDRVDAALIAVADPGPGRRDHDRLVRWLFLGCLALAAAAGLAGHLLSGRSMRPALRTLEQQEQFLSEAAHELRTPLATLRMVTSAGAAAPDTAPRELARATRLVDQLGRLVTGLLVRARVQAGTQEVEREALRLDQLVEQVVDELPPSGARFVVRTEPTVVRGDPELLAQAVRNLVDNAVKHGGGDAAIDVEVADGAVRVRDRGPGVAEGDRERVFERRAMGPTGGTGIGLAIVRWVADLHGGTARITDAPGGGAVAELRLPTEPAPESRPEPPREPAEPREP